jgi:hypothetical protein
MLAILWGEFSFSPSLLVSFSPRLLVSKSPYVALTFDLRPATLDNLCSL